LRLCNVKLGHALGNLGHALGNKPTLYRSKHIMRDKIGCKKLMISKCLGHTTTKVTEVTFERYSPSFIKVAAETVGS
jgi:hypothetical protein